jgi:hypothetical protein
LKSKAADGAYNSLQFFLLPSLDKFSSSNEVTKSSMVSSFEVVEKGRSCHANKLLIALEF